MRLEKALSRLWADPATNKCTLHFQWRILSKVKVFKVRKSPSLDPAVEKYNTVNINLETFKGFLCFHLDLSPSAVHLLDFGLRRSTISIHLENPVSLEWNVSPVGLLHGSDNIDSL